MEKKMYESPKMEAIKVETQSVICDTSAPGPAGASLPGVKKTKGGW